MRNVSPLSPYLFPITILLSLGAQKKFHSIRVHISADSELLYRNCPISMGPIDLGRRMGLFGHDKLLANAIPNGLNLDCEWGSFQFSVRLWLIRSEFENLPTRDWWIIVFLHILRLIERAAKINCSYSGEPAYTGRGNGEPSHLEDRYLLPPS